MLRTVGVLSAGIRHFSWHMEWDSSHFIRHRDVIDAALPRMAEGDAFFADLCRLFLLHRHVPRGRVRSMLGGSVLDALLRLRILAESPSAPGRAAGSLYATVMMVPIVADIFVVTPWPEGGPHSVDGQDGTPYCSDEFPFCEPEAERQAYVRVQPVLTDALELIAVALHGTEGVTDDGLSWRFEGAFDWLGQEPSDVSDESVPRTMHVLDLCTGQGLHGLVAARLYAARAVLVDLNPRAARFARFNLALNNIGPERAVVALGNLYDAVATLPPPWRDTRFDLILSNPPYHVHFSGINLAADGGRDGEELPRRIVSEGRRWLAPGGRMLQVLLM